MEGVDELKARLDHLGKRGIENALRSAMRKTMNTLRDPIRAAAPEDTGALKKGLVVKISSGKQISGRFGTVKDVKYEMTRERAFSELSAKEQQILRHGGLGSEKRVNMIKGQIKEPDKYGYVQEKRKAFMRPIFEGKKEEMTRIFHQEVDAAVARAAAKAGGGAGV